MLNVTRSLVGILTSLTVNVAGFRVEACDAGGICADLIYVAITNGKANRGQASFLDKIS